MKNKRKRTTIANPIRFYTFIAILIVMMAMLLIFLNAVILQPNHAYGASDKPSTVEIVVHRGDTVWSIAQGIADDDKHDVRDIVSQIIDLNNLTQASIYPGQPLLVPSI